MDYRVQKGLENRGAAKGEMAMGIFKRTHLIISSLSSITIIIFPIIISQSPLNYRLISTPVIIITYLILFFVFLNLLMLFLVFKLDKRFVSFLFRFSCVYSALVFSVLMIVVVFGMPVFCNTMHDSTILIRSIFFYLGTYRPIFIFFRDLLR
jgi:hypothetical protein